MNYRLDSSLRSTITSTSFFQIPLHSLLLVRRQDEVLSVMGDTLLSILRQQISRDDSAQLRPPLRDAINGIVPPGTEMTVATTRNPEFGDEMESPHTGYQVLSVNIHAPTICPPGVSFDPNREVLSMASTTNHMPNKTADFLSLWSNLCLQPNRHFFLVFQMDPLSPYHIAFTTPSTVAPPSQSIALVYPHFPSPLTDRSSGSPASTGSPSADEHGQHGITLEQQLLSLPGITEQQIRDAYFVRDQPLFRNVKNWNSVAHLIEAGYLSDSANEDMILRHFSWAPTSYRKKKRLFTWAKRASGLQWVGSTSTCKP